MGHSSFRDLDAWRYARRLVKSVYALAGRLPDHEKYNLASQMRRAVQSVHANIAEGRGRLSNGEWQQFLGQARGSLMELESHLIVAFDLKYCSRDDAAEVGKAITHVARLLNGLLRASRKGFPAKQYKSAP